MGNRFNIAPASRPVVEVTRQFAAPASRVGVSRASCNASGACSSRGWWRTRPRKNMRLRLLIVDDNARFLQAARDLLQRQGADVVGVASNGAEALRLARELQPDCVLVDIELGPESGFDLATRLTTEYHQRVVLISVHSETEFLDLIADHAAPSGSSPRPISRSGGSPRFSTMPARQRD